MCIRDREMLDASHRHPELVAQLVPAPFDFRTGPTVARLLREGAVGDIYEVHITVPVSYTHLTLPTSDLV